MSVIIVVNKKKIIAFELWVFAVSMPSTDICRTRCDATRQMNVFVPLSCEPMIWKKTDHWICSVVLRPWLYQIEENYIPILRNIAYIFFSAFQVKLIFKCIYAKLDNFCLQIAQITVVNICIFFLLFTSYSNQIPISYSNVYVSLFIVNGIRNDSVWYTAQLQRVYNNFENLH